MLRIDLVRYFFSVLILIMGGLSFAPVYSEQATGVDIKANGEYLRKAFLERMKKPFKPNGNKKLLIIGDSHAQDFLNSVLENGFLKDYQISTRYIPTRCQIFLAEKMDTYIKHEDKELCSTSDNLLQAKDQIATADIIILAAFWREWAAQTLPQTIHNLRLSPAKKLFVIGRKSFNRLPKNNYQKLPKKSLRKVRIRVDEHQQKINNILRNQLDKSIFINIQRLVCGVSDSCPAFTNDYQLITFDGGHLSKAGARYIGKILFSKSELAHL